MNEEKPRRDRSGIKQLIAIIPALENAKGPLAKHNIETRGDTVCIGPMDYGPELSKLTKAFHESNLLIDFDWGEWQDQAVHYHENPELIQALDVKTIRMLLTLHFRKERFCEGHLATVCEDGSMVLILKRLKELCVSNEQDFINPDHPQNRS